MICKDIDARTGTSDCGSCLRISYIKCMVRVDIPSPSVGGCQGGMWPCASATTLEVSEKKARIFMMNVGMKRYHSKSSNSLFQVYIPI